MSEACRCLTWTRTPGTGASCAERLDRSQTLARWSLSDPELAGLNDVAHLVRLTRPGCDPARADRILGALVRRAAGTGGDDDALLLLLHLLSDMVVALATDLADLSQDVLPIVVNELVCQIRSIDPDQPVRGGAVTLKWATRRAVLAEFRPGLRRNHPDAGERPSTPPTSPAGRDRASAAYRPHRSREQTRTSTSSTCCCGLSAMASPQKTSACSPQPRSPGQRDAADADQGVAAQFGVGVATLYRRNKRTLAALRRCGADYLAAVA